MSDALNRPGWDGLNILERQAKERAEKDDRSMRKAEAAMLRDIDSRPMECFHSPDCPGDICKDTTRRARAAEEQYRKTMAQIEAEETPAWRKLLEEGGRTTMPKHLTSSLSKPKVSTAVANSSTKQPVKPSKKPLAPSAKTQLVNSKLAANRPKITAGPPTTNPSPMRHNAAMAASKTTMGYSQGRKTSATLRQQRKSVLPLAGKENNKKTITPDTTLAPAEYISRYGVPRVGTDIWFRCQGAGCFDKEEEGDDEEGQSFEELMGLGKEDLFLNDAADQDFVLTLQQ